MPLILRAKVIVLGDAAVGKSSLVQVFHSDGQRFQKNYLMSSGVELLVKSVLLPQTNGDQVEMYVYDCAGKDVYVDVVEQHIDRPDICLLVYDVTNEASFTRCSQWLSKLQKQNRDRTVPTALIAHKVDLENRRIVTNIQGQELANNNNLMYFEVSSKDGVNVDTVFTELAKKYAEMYAEKCKQIADLA